MTVVPVSESPFTAETDKPQLQRVVTCGQTFEDGIGREFKERCERWYRQYRGFSKLRSAWIAAGPNDRDGLLLDAKRDWGANLHIPLSFRTIETVVPASIAQRPRMQVFPRQMRWAENVAHVRLLLDAQQDQIDIDLPLQAIMRSGRINGLGVGKVTWRKEYATRRRMVKHPFKGKLSLTSGGVQFDPHYYPGAAQAECIFDDPDLEDVDVFDFMWDPYGSDLRSCGWVIHRTWRSIEYCLAKMRSGEWSTDSVKALLKDGREEEHLRIMGGRSRYDEVWQARMEASGFTTSNFTTRGEHVHEVWEWHDGNQVHTALDRGLLVVDGENQCVGSKPFVIYRPTPLQKQFVGIGDMEPLEHLNRELDTARSQQRDATTMALAVGWAYDSQAVDEEDLVFAPNMAVEVRNASPRDAIVPLQRPEVPGISYKDQEVIRADIDAVAGVTEALNPNAGGAAGTATEAFLVQASLSRRIELSSRRFEIEVVRNGARLFMHLNQRMIRDQREIVRPADGMTPDQASHEGKWQQFLLGPGELMGDFEYREEGGSMAARNVPQDRQDAQMFLGLAQNPYIDPRRATLRALELAGVDDPQGWLRQSDPPIPPMVLQTLEQMGVDPRKIQFAIQQAQQQSPQLPAGDPNAQGPNVAQMNGAMGAAQ